MSFVSIDFGLLVVACLALYPWLSRERQNVLLLIASCVFYGAWDVRFLLLMGFTITMDWWIAQRIHSAAQAGDPAGAKRFVRLSLAMNLGSLAFFKYCGFFVEQAYAALTHLGVHANKPMLHIVLPLGISFHTFQTLSHSIDVYRGRLTPTRSWIEYAVFIMFFPQLVAGPIERAAHMLPQYQQPRTVTFAHVQDGLWLILLGYFRKVAIADTAATLCEPMFSAPSQQDTPKLVAGLLLFTLQIYGDFSGYSDIARGTAKLFGFDLMRNFEHPYFARNVSDFWRRWHISLSTWLRDYLYVPLGGNRAGELRTYRNLMITMLLGGLWHGASWNFVIWGGLHGAYLCIHRALQPVLGRVPATGVIGSAFTLGGSLLTFALVAFTWLFFRSTSFDVTLQYLSGFGNGGNWQLRTFAPLLMLSAMVLIVDIPQSVLGHEVPFARAPRLVRVPLAAAMLALLCMSQDSGQPFIYFQF